jgi:hypothetical protein
MSPSLSVNIESRVSRLFMLRVYDDDDEEDDGCNDDIGTEGLDEDDELRVSRLFVLPISILRVVLIEV